MLYNYTSIVFNITRLINKAINKADGGDSMARGRKPKFDSIEALSEIQFPVSGMFHGCRRGNSKIESEECTSATDSGRRSVACMV